MTAMTGSAYCGIVRRSAGGSASGGVVGCCGLSRGVKAAMGSDGGVH